MKVKIFLFLLLVLAFACKKNTKNIKTEHETKISSRLAFTEKGAKLVLKSGKFSYNFEKNQLPFNRIILLNASLIGYITALKSEDKIVGISSPQYIYSEKIHELMANGNIQNIGNEQQYDVEKIIALKPDVILTNHISTFENTYEILKKNNIEVIFLDEYLEQNPLEKSAYIKVFGKILDQEKRADSIFTVIENNYKDLEKLALTSNKKPIVLANEMYGSQWFLPGGKTQTANFLNSANASYILSNNHDEKAVPISFEEVFVKSQKANMWINAGNHKTKKEMLAMNPNYSKMNVWNHGKIYTVTGREKGKSNDYFESGVVRSDLVLKDYIKIFHPHLLPDYQLIYMKELR